MINMYCIVHDDSIIITTKNENKYWLRTGILQEWKTPPSGKPTNQNTLIRSGADDKIRVELTLK